MIAYRMEDIIIKNLLFDYFSGHSTPLQKKVIEAWLQDKANQEYYYQWLHEWELTHLQAPTSWQDAFARTKELVNQETPESQPFLSVSTNNSWWSSYTYKLVASIALITLLGATIFGLKDSIVYKTIQVGYGQTQQVKLTDGSLVTLNANSSIRFPRFGFGDGTRTVELTGEADFQVQHSPLHQRFVVVTPKGLQVTVLGTQFTVFARQRRSQITLRTGKVALQMSQTPKAPSIIMKPGDLVTMDNAGKLTRAHTANPEVQSAWKHQRFTLERTSLNEIASILQENYGFQVEIKDPELANRTATGSFRASNADEVLEMITELFDINLTRQDNKIVFKD
ncbi:FecR family protein [Spirosoma foliorum]|uniref:FecR domain-containing protein n=1 Tax=Spirosoma foliorum TaxID=2710596 RepID=A0A7G5H110_9BACT|nr:FecR domain-containing protein [Spirosoma foliorum]QMW04802.1 FecR domain-containing protein [Spirosoma foliorum]